MMKISVDLENQLAAVDLDSAGPSSASNVDLDFIFTVG